MTDQEPVVPGTLGQSLKNRRLQKGLTLEEVTRVLRIQPRYLKALEAERWEDLPARVYVEGFLAKYAEFLGLDAFEIVGTLRDRLGDHQKPAFSNPKPIPEAVDNTSSAPVRWGLLLVALVLAGAGGFYFFRHQEARGTLSDLPLNQVTEPEVVYSSASLVESPVFVAPSVPMSAAYPARGHNIVLHARDAVWVRVRLDGAVKFEGTLGAGEIRTWPFSSAMRVRAGSLSRVTVTVDGTPFPDSPRNTPGDFVWPQRSGPAVLTQADTAISTVAGSTSSAR